MSKSTGSYADAGTMAAAFATRDRYYWEMAQRIIYWASKRSDKDFFEKAVNLGAGIGMSTMEMLKGGKFGFIYAVEPDPSMRFRLKLNTLGDPRVRVLKAWADSFSKRITPSHVGQINAVVCSETFHNFLGRDDLDPADVLGEISAVLASGGVFAFNLGPTAYEFAKLISDHRTGLVNKNETMTELSHPLYQRAHQIAVEIAQQKYSVTLDNLWKPAQERVSFDQLKAMCDAAGLFELEVHEELHRLSGQRIIEFIRNAWTIWMRGDPLQSFDNNQRQAFMAEVLTRLQQVKDFDDMLAIEAEHPTAIFTVVKA